MSTPVTAAVAAEHGLSEEEYEALIEANLIGTEYDPEFNVDPEDRV